LVENILAAIIEKIPAPKGNKDEPLQALIFDSHYNPFRGVIEVIFECKNGEIRKKGDKVKFMATGKEYFADEVGVLTLKLNPSSKRLHFWRCWLFHFRY
jgi:GTP-binding protein LepA